MNEGKSLSNSRETERQEPTEFELLLIFLLLLVFLLLQSLKKGTWVVLLFWGL